MRKVLILLSLILVAAPVAAQWRRAGLYGADVRALIVDPVAPDSLFLGTSSGEVYVSDDGAKSWSNPRNGVPFPGHVVDNLLLDRSGRLWAACWGLWGGGVIAASDDRGKTWTRRDAGLEDFSVRAIAIDPNDADFVLVGGLSGVYRSVDGGETWEKISDQINVESLAIDPRSRERIYVGTWRQGLRTDDGGATWKLINNGMVLDTDMFAITIEEDNPDSLWVSTCGWVYNTADRGEKWTRYRDGFNNRRIHDIEVDPCSPDVLYAGSVAGLYRSEDRGKSWYTVSDEELVVNTIVLHPQRPNRIILGVEGDGVYISEDAARTFARSSDGLRNVRVAAVAADPVVKDRVYTAAVVGAAASGVYQSDDAGRNWKRLSTTRLPTILSLTIAPEPDIETRFVAGTEKGFYWSPDGIVWTQSAPVNAPLRVDKVLRFNGARYFAATSDGVFTSRDAGKSWYRLAGAWNRAVDIALGHLNQNRALYALTESGVMVFDGERWLPVPDAPKRGRTIAIRDVQGAEVVFVAGAQGVKAGVIDYDGRWLPADAPDAQYASVFGANRSVDQLLFLTSRQQREILVGLPAERDWLTLMLPSATSEVTAVVPDQIRADRFYVGTLGEGVYVYEGRAQKYVARKKEPAIESSSGYVAGSGSN